MFSDIYFLIFGLPVICGTLIVLAVILKSKKKEPNSDESKLIQELHHGLTRMEKRIESLESIILNTEQQPPKNTKP